MSGYMSYQAKRYISDYFNVDCSHLPDRKVFDFIESQYIGGLSAFKWDYRSSSELAYEVPTKSEPQTIPEKIALALRTVGRKHLRLGRLDEVISVQITDDKVLFAIECYEVTEHTFRWKVNKKGIRITGWEKTDFNWKPIKPTTSWDDDFEPYEVSSQYSNLMTEDRLTDKLEQASDCWRPGTDSHPLDGESVRDTADKMLLDLKGIGYFL